MRLLFHTFLANITIIFVICGVISCDQDINRESDQIGDEDESFIKPFSVFLYNSECQEKGRSRPQNSGFPGSEQLISKTSYGTIWSRDCGEPSCRDARGNTKRYNLIGSEKYLHFCDPESAYPRLSFEAVGQSVTKYLFTANRRFKNWMQDRPIPSLQLSIFPEFRSIHRYADQEEFHSWKVNNLAYFSGSNKIAVYPPHEKENDRDPSGKSGKLSDAEGFKYLWESPFVLAHEFAHHIEQNISLSHQEFSGLLSGNQDTDQGNYQFTAGGQSQGKHPWTKVSQIFSIQFNDLQNLKYLQGFSEGFADLLAFYTTYDDSLPLKGLPCFELNRFVQESRFSSQEMKILTPEIEKSLLNEINANSICGQTIPASKYTLGSIFAYQANKAFEVAINDLLESQKLSETEITAIKYRLTITWMSSFYSGYQRSSGFESSTIRQILTSLKKTISNHVESHLKTDSIQTSDIMSRVCESLMTGFPAQDVCRQQSL